MAHGLHWEWRAFGGVSGRFLKKFSDLPFFLESHTVQDLYIWIPGLEVNSKFRTGGEGGLKFKRKKDTDGQIEKWMENPKEIFDFPLRREAWETLSRTLETVQINLPWYPSEPPGRKEVQDYLMEAGCKTVLVKKQREAKVWSGPNADVIIEWTCISEPQSFISIGLENGNDSQSTDNDEQVKADIRAAIDVFGLDNEPLHVMNYMEAVEIWAKGDKI